MTLIAGEDQSCCYPYLLSFCFFFSRGLTDSFVFYVILGYPDFQFSCFQESVVGILNIRNLRNLWNKKRPIFKKLLELM